LVAIVVGLGHVSTFSDESEWRPKGSITTVGAADLTITAGLTMSGRSAEREFAAQLPPQGLAK
jgi:hypothetical protein